MSVCILDAAGKNSTLMSHSIYRYVVKLYFTLLIW
ncbi:unnamed protein product [Gongylonema pulchrum]|uniref:Uncharacterized protein n=1 Tax=Gongylonema pulchrum TaxID=637853 RepID=A0A183DVP6_9BILA|nr:unnamed protein product [Gongylonema pulchrum]